MQKKDSKNNQAQQDQFPITNSFTRSKLFGTEAARDAPSSVPIANTIQDAHSLSTKQQFVQTCLQDLHLKLQSFGELKKYSILALQQQMQNRMQKLSQKLVLLEDEITKYLRSRFKTIIQIEQARGLQLINNFAHDIQTTLQQHQHYITKMIKCLEKGMDSDSKSSKIMGKIASGKVQEQFELLNRKIFGYQLQQPMINFDQETILQVVDEMFEALHIKYPPYCQQGIQQSSDKGTEDIQKNEAQLKMSKNRSKITEKMSNNLNQNKSKQKAESTLQKSAGDKNGNRSLMTAYANKIGNTNQNKSLNNRSRMTWLKNNESIMSINMEERSDSKKNRQLEINNDQGDTIAIDEYKQTKTIKKLKKIQQKYKQKQLFPQKDVEKIAKLALERNKLLKQLQ